MRRSIAVLTGIEILLMGALSVAPQAQAQGSESNGRIVFIRSDSRGNNLSYTTNPNGSDERLLFPGKADWARWSPDGRQLDVRNSDLLAATIVDVATGVARDLQIPDPAFTCTPTTTQDQCENTDFSCPAWSPDGSRLACSAFSGADPSRDGIYSIRSSDGGDLTLIKSCPPACAGVGDFSPDGKRLVFISTDENDQLRIYTIKLNGSGMTPLTPAGMDLNDEDFARWSPQGDKILFAARPAPGHRSALWVVGSDGTGLHQIPIQSCGGAFTDPTSVGCPQAGWSPDGTKIVFSRVSSKGRQENIYTVNADGSGMFQVTHSGFLDLYPDWGTQPAG
jgi:Tol biopolymer transport system component